jgi:hydroxyacyl-ACP dehydratase HTD2-like protein with hotdog domain
VEIRRWQSTASEVIDAFRKNESNPALKPFNTTDLLSPTQSTLLTMTLQPYIPFPIKSHETTLLQGRHIVYFPTAAVPESQLDSDGTETTFNPGHPFNRRMWAGGRMEWPREGDLVMGEPTKEIMELDKIEAKSRGGGGELIVMSIRKRLLDKNDALAVNETRQWVFLKDGDASAAQSSSKKSEIATKNQPERESVFQHSIHLTPAALFRYSALIFNSHAIHLYKEHCLKEGHPNLVVHGPLTLSLLLEAVRGQVASRWKSMTYRAVGPAYVGETLTLYVGKEHDGKVEAWAGKGEHRPVMNVNIELW